MSKVLRYELQWDEETHTLAQRAAHAAKNMGLNLNRTPLSSTTTSIFSRH